MRTGPATRLEKEFAAEDVTAADTIDDDGSDLMTPSGIGRELLATLANTEGGSSFINPLASNVLMLSTPDSILIDVETAVTDLDSSADVVDTAIDAFVSTADAAGLQ